MESGENISLPLLGELVPGGFRPGTALVVEFDPDSQWLAVATTITAKFLQAESRVVYGSFTRPPENVYRHLSAIGVDLPVTEKALRLFVDDWFSATFTGGRLERLAEPIRTGVHFGSLKVADLSVEWTKDAKVLQKQNPVDPLWPPSWKALASWPPGYLLVADSFSVFLRFNKEDVFLEWLLTRERRETRITGRISLEGFVRGLHSESLYKGIEAANDGIIDVRVMERDDEAGSFLRVRSLKGQPHDARWHRIDIKPNGEAILNH